MDPRAVYARLDEIKSSDDFIAEAGTLAEGRGKGSGTWDGRRRQDDFLRLFWLPGAKSLGKSPHRAGKPRTFSSTWT